MNIHKIFLGLTLIPLGIILVLTWIIPEPLLYRDIFLFLTIFLLLISYNSYIDKVKGKKK